MANITEYSKEEIKLWAKSAVIRAVKTAAQSALGVMGASHLIAEVNWVVVLSAAGFAAIVSVLTSLGGLPEVDGK